MDVDAIEMILIIFGSLFCIFINCISNIVERDVINVYNMQFHVY